MEIQIIEPQPVVVKTAFVNENIKNQIKKFLDNNNDKDMFVTNHDQIATIEYANEDKSNVRITYCERQRNEMLVNYIVYYNRQGQIDNKDGPAIIMFSDEKIKMEDAIESNKKHNVMQFVWQEKYLMCNISHREDGPQNIKYRSINGQSCIENESYMQYGMMHRIGGPAAIQYENKEKHIEAVRKFYVQDNEYTGLSNITFAMEKFKKEDGFKKYREVFQELHKVEKAMANKAKNRMKM